MNRLRRSFIKNTYDNFGRVYHMTIPVEHFPVIVNENTPIGASYHSVTTALGNTADKEWLVRWRENVGDELADILVEKAQNMGEQFHLMGEHHLKSMERPVDIHPFVQMIFSRLRPWMKKITSVYASEVFLYSDIAELAGRVDGVVDWEGVLSVLDFKLVNYWEDAYIHDYWLQCTIYAHMWEMMFGVKPQQIILAMGNKKTGMARVIIKKPGEFAQESVVRIQQFRQMVKV